MKESYDFSTNLIVNVRAETCEAKNPAFKRDAKRLRNTVPKIGTKSHQKLTSAVYMGDPCLPGETPSDGFCPEREVSEKE